MRLLNRIEELEKELLELKEQAKEEQEFPLAGDKYWFMSDSGGAIDTSFYSNYYIDNDRIDIGNFFKGREDTEFAIEKLKVEAELRKFSRPFKEDEYNYFIQIDSSYNNIVVDSDDCYQTQGTIYFENVRIANKAIETVGAKRIKKYIFGTED